MKSCATPPRPVGLRLSISVLAPKEYRMGTLLVLAGAEGIEPPTSVLETEVIPFN